MKTYLINNTNYALKEKYTLKDWGTVLKIISGLDLENTVNSVAVIMAEGKLQELLAVILNGKIEGEIFEDDFQTVLDVINDFFHEKKFDQKYQSTFSKLNADYETTFKKLEGLSELAVEYFEPDAEILNNLDLISYKLSEGDITKTTIIENLYVSDCYNWFYLQKVKELNEMKVRIAEWEKIKS